MNSKNTYLDINKGYNIPYKNYTYKGNDKMEY